MFLCSHLCFLNAQTSLIVSLLDISHYNVKPIKGRDFEDDGEGPRIGADCIIKNNSKSDSIEINFSDSKVYFEFMYKGSIYKQSPFYFNAKGKVLLYPQDSCSFSFGVPIFLGTLIHKDKKLNYTAELLEILPTIKVIYKQKELKLISEEITSVKLYD
jgi:hypothetical protein